ncbi:hypothetical protein [Methanolapillus millepedarum]|uniref:Uncharacterized protein n=1 Tax=Methanolapillus millepedarum TaxID=3028296 RepID=A0AA96ZUG7_9EURY|nr:hypothetical protein MsAc7_12880 [Methanosarcinaceae archaeon Ac7]
MTAQTSKIRFYPSSNTYVIPKGAFFDESVIIHGNMIAGPGVHFWKNVAVQGNAQLGKGCTVAGTLKAKTAIVGAKSKVDKIKTEWNASVFQNATVQSIDCGGHLVIMDGSVVGYANAEKTLEILGKADIKKLGPVTKVTVRTDEVRLFEEHEEEEEDENPKNEIKSEAKTDEIAEMIEIDAVEIIAAEIEIESEESFFESPVTAEIKPETEIDSVSAPAASEEEKEEDAEIIGDNAVETVTQTVIETAFGPVTIEEYSYDTESKFDFDIDEEKSDVNSGGDDDKIEKLYETGTSKPKFLKHTSSPKKTIEPEDDDAEVYEDEKKESSYVNFNRKRKLGGAELIYDIERDGEFDPTIPTDAAKMYEKNNSNAYGKRDDPFKKNEKSGMKDGTNKDGPESEMKKPKVYPAYDTEFSSQKETRKSSIMVKEVQISEFMIKEPVVKEKRRAIPENNDRSDAKKWYEERERSVSKMKKKEYPPYI